jgi:hypothetical protein
MVEQEVEDRRLLQEMVEQMGGTPSEGGGDDDFEDGLG